MDVYVTNQCNSGCRSCFVDTVKGAKGAVHLQWKDFKAAIDVFMDPAQAPAAARKEIAIAGGEPFLVYPLLLKAAKYVRHFPRRPHLYIHTNGTLVRPEQIRELRAHNAGIVFSIDGGRQAHDRCRPYAKGGRMSSWKTVMDKLRDTPKDGLGTNSVLRPANLDTMLPVLEGFRKLGFRFCDLWIDYLHVWTPAELKQLRRFCRDFADYYVERTQADGRIPFYTGGLAHALFVGANRRGSRAWWKDCFRLTLGADGNFYDCEAMGCAPYAKVLEPHGINHARSGRGIDWAKRQSYMDAAYRRLRQLGAEDAWQHVCPRLYYTVAQCLGAELAPLIDNLHRVSELFFTELVKLSTRLRRHPDFIRNYTSSRYPHVCDAQELSITQR